MLYKKTITFLLFVFVVQICHAQFVQYCGSLRYDTEVFPTVQITTNITYGSNISSSGTLTTLKLDVYEPDGDTISERPLIIWVHGGSFIGGTKNDVDVTSLCEHFAKRGYVCASIDYRLGFSVFPPNTAAAAQTVYRAVQDMKAAVRFFRKDAATTNTFRINSDVIFGGGSSAGAFTALHLAYMDESSEIPVGIDTTILGNLEGESGNPGYSSKINAVIDLCGALGDKTWMHINNVPFAALHGNWDATVPYGADTIFFLGLYPLTIVDGSYSISDYANTIGLYNEMYSFYNAGHVPFASSLEYMDTTVRFVSNFLYKYLGCIPSDPSPLANTFPTGINSVSNDDNISIYPNPGNGIFNVNFIYDEKEFQISIYDMSGRKLKVIDRLKKNNTVNISEFSNGIYFYTIRNENRLFSGRLIKVN